jgi:hypothetical protein
MVLRRRMADPKSEGRGLKPCPFESLYGTTEVVPSQTRAVPNLLVLAEN